MSFEKHIGLAYRIASQKSFVALGHVDEDFVQEVVCIALLRYAGRKPVTPTRKQLQREVIRQFGSLAVWRAKHRYPLLRRAWLQTTIARLTDVNRVRNAVRSAAYSVKFGQRFAGRNQNRVIASTQVDKIEIADHSVSHDCVAEYAATLEGKASVWAILASQGCSIRERESLLGITNERPIRDAIRSDLARHGCRSVADGLPSEPSTLPDDEFTTYRYVGKAKPANRIRAYGCELTTKPSGFRVVYPEIPERKPVASKPVDSTPVRRMSLDAYLEAYGEDMSRLTVGRYGSVKQLISK